MRSTVSLVILLAAAAGYVYTDSSFVVHAYIWVAVWYIIFCFDQVFIKHVVDNVKVESNWGRVFYTNLWACLLSSMMMTATEPQVIHSLQWTPIALCALCISCLLGVMMSYFAFLCRASVSATSFTIIGNVCKLLTVLINVSIWNKHATPIGIFFLCICLVAAFLYKPSPMRKEAYQPVGSVELEAASTGREGDSLLVSSPGKQ